MVVAQSIGWWNTGVPLLFLGGLAAVLPRFLVSRQARAQRVVAQGIAAAVVVILAAGAMVFALVYAAAGSDVGAAMAVAPVATAWFFVRLSGLAAMVWGPVLALVWLGLAQGVERRRGIDKMLEDQP